MSASTRPETAQPPSSEIKQDDLSVEKLSSGNAKQDPLDYPGSSDAKQAQPAYSNPEQNSKSTEEGLESTEQPQEAHHEPVADKGKSTITELASSAATTATNAALGVKDNVFSMFGGGAKKEKKEEVADDPEDRSGSAKAQKESKAEAEGEVILSLGTRYSYFTLTHIFVHRMSRPSPLMYILNRYIF